MSENAWRSLVSDSSRRGISSLRNFKDYISQRDFKEQFNTVRAGPGGRQGQGWREWAGEKIKYGRSQNNTPPPPPSERVALFPGWAVRRHQEFEVDVFISGFAASQRSPENASRSQRAFMRLAKSFASLPKLVADVADPESGPSTPLSRSTEDLLASIKLPPRPTEITEDYEVQCLEQQLRRASHQDSVDSIANDPRANVAAQPLLSDPETIPAAVAADLRRLHENLEKRLRPFWSSSLAGRTVRVSLLANSSQGNDHGPLACQEFTTTADGSFQGHVTVKWEDLCQHPKGLHIAFGSPCMEHDLMLLAELMPLPTPSLPTPTSSSDEASPTESRAPYSVYRPNAMVIPQVPPDLTTPTATTSIRVTVSHSEIRVISDIDDTVKRSNILSGARAVFHNVFVKDYHDIIIPGMGEWYTSMWSRGIRFHYVSNGPFELLPVVIDFLHASQLPPGSIKLKSYGGRSLFNGLLSAPASRKRAGIEEVLDAFPKARFMLIGDSGEQDLELYAEIAKERPHQVLAVFIRFAEDTTEMLPDPTGWKAIGAASTSSLLVGDTISVPAGATTPDQRDPSTPVIGKPGSKRTLSDLVPGVGSLTISIPSKLSPSQPRSPSAVSGSPGYFTSSPLTAEPERYSPPNGNGSSGAKLTGQWNSYKHRISNSSSSSSSHSSQPLRPPSTTSSVSSAYLRMSEPDKKKVDLQTRIIGVHHHLTPSMLLSAFRSVRHWHHGSNRNIATSTDLLRKQPKFRVSKTVTWLLRHGGKNEGIDMRTDGFVRVQDLLRHPALRGLDFMQLEDLVQTDKKGRFSMSLGDGSESNWLIRANQGHSIADVTLDLTPILSADQVPMAVHGTTQAAWKLICEHLTLPRGISTTAVVTNAL
ncbi:hypothetical protein ONZ45_g11184 [Pleurotus djamor]|nr:hypothetical protein ONZ45_g11184 [Pleurotus djamor]